MCIRDRYTCFYPQSESGLEFRLPIYNESTHYRQPHEPLLLQKDKFLPEHHSHSLFCFQIFEINQIYNPIRNQYQRTLNNILILKIRSNAKSSYFYIASRYVTITAALTFAVYFEPSFLEEKQNA